MQHMIDGMPKRISEQELGDILAVVAAHPEGARIGVIREGLPCEMPARTLQRRLALMVAQNRLIAEGRCKGRRYRTHAARAGKDNAVASNATAGAHGEANVPISPEAAAIKQAIRASVQKRHPVGYQRSFIDDYVPNVTFYLPAATRRHLHVMGRPPDDGGLPAGTYARTIYGRLLIELSWNSSRLEGNTYSLLETERLLELGEAAEGKDVLETQMILNHKAAIELLVDHASEIGFNRYTVLNLHALLADNLLGDPRAVGRLRHIPVSIGGTVYQPLEVPQLIEECFEKILNTAAAISDPFEQAFFVLAHLAYLQGFEDVNKRVARLAANIPLIQGNFCPLSFVDVQERAYVDGLLAVYELNRTELLRDVFIWGYERSCVRHSAVRQSRGEPDPFRLRYREMVAEAVSRVVRTGMDKTAAIALVRHVAASQLLPVDQARFVEIVETELMSLHDGNIARYRLRPTEFQGWQKGWH